MSRISASTTAAALLLLIAATTPLANAHVVIKGLNGQSNCLRPFRTGETVNFPITGAESDELMCNALGADPNVKIPACEVAAGGNIEIEYWHNPSGKFEFDNFVIHPSHKGGCAAYLSDNLSVRPGVDKNWAKIAEQGRVGDKFCTELVNQNDGRWNFKVPAGLKEGTYLLRTELIPLHLGSGKPEHYVQCAHIKVTGGGSGTLQGERVAIPSPEYQNPSMPGVKINIYNIPNTGDIPVLGPKVATVS
ncbi:hypothetical protein HK102_003210 [Quaeritorhiza haematococci]|nr:hypothetical protein HK102_003210 [Quaeritorhiza haematococci]